MNRELQFQLYQDFIVNCTTVSKSVKNYSDFKRINECLSLLFPAKKDVSILDFDNPIEFEDVISKLLIQKQFVDYEQKGGNQYSNTLKHYLRFLYAKMMFSKTSNLASNNIDNNLPLQTIFYGAPGTGKSHEIDGKTNDDNSIRTTFHPDTDYATFVGAYKPMMDTVDEYALDATGKTHQVIYPNDKKSIVYKFEPQVFLKAYVEAWKRFLNKQEGEDDRYYLVIEEINRGNCAQIFGDLFQLLDRENDGYSSYAISPESAITKYMSEEAQSADGTKFADLGFSDVTKIRDGVEKIIATADDLKAGKCLVLPPNLHIWATMNTSDQSLFPIDSAFKRRWEWQYMPIGKGFDENGREIKWAIEGATKKYDWWSFLEKINAQVGEATQSEDKKLGFFFCKATDGEISAEKFVGKVIFYLWNDVFKNNGFEGPIFKDVDGTELSFGKFYKSDMKGKAIVQKDKVELFLNNLGVEIVEEDFDDDIDDIEEGEEDATRVSDTNSPYRVTFPDGEVICEDNGWETYIASLQKIGLEKALPFGEMYSRMNKTLPLITKKKIADQGVYKYYEVDNYYVLRGTDSQHRLLKRMNKDLDLGLTIE